MPFFEKRIEMGGYKIKHSYFRKFYNDTALYGNTSALMCGYAFFGSDHLLFGTDMPMGTGVLGTGHMLETIRSIEQMDISEIEKYNIFEGNARQLLQLSL